MATSNRFLDAMDDFNASPSLTIAQLRNIGQAALRCNQYEDAIRAFDRALEKAKAQNSTASRLAGLALLDLRVETRLRSNKYGRARKDAKAMIRVDRTDARGYIRLGQIKQLHGDRSAALKSYSTGLEYVPTNSPLRDVLKIKYENTLRAITRSKLTDPVAVLPAELLQMILYHFDYREATAIIRVSKSWRDAIVTLPLIRTTLDFSSRYRPISGVAFKACVRRLSAPPSVVVAEKLSGPATRELRKHLAAWIRLEYLELRNISIEITSVHCSKSLEVLIVGEQQKLNRANVCRILSTCSSLRIACFSSVKSKGNDDFGDHWMNDQAVRMPQMQSLTIQGLLNGGNGPGGLVWPTTFFTRYPDLQELCLSNMDLQPQAMQEPLDLSVFSCLRSLTMHQVSVDKFPALPPSLEILNCRAWPSRVEAWPMQFMGTDQQHQSAQSYLTRLRTIQFIDMGRQILSPLAHLPPVGEPNVLAQLDLHNCQIGLGHFMWFLERSQLRKLKALRVSFPDLDDDCLDSFLTHCPDLETLILINTRITGVFVKGLVTAPGSQLKRLSLCGVDSPVSFDAVEWAHSRGVNVDWNGYRYPSVGGRQVAEVQSLSKPYQVHLQK